MTESMSKGCRYPLFEEYNILVQGTPLHQCELKYVIHTPGHQPGPQMNMFTLSNGIMQV